MENEDNLKKGTLGRSKGEENLQKTAKVSCFKDK